MRGTRGITLIGLIITIILLLILAGIVITQLIGSGLFAKSKAAKIITDYTSAKERIELELMAIQTECVSEGKKYNIIEIEKDMEEIQDITIDNIYYSNTAKLKDMLELDVNRREKIIGILVSVDQYSQYKFLIGEGGTIEKVGLNEIPDEIDSKKLKPIEEFEKDVIGIIPEIDNDNKEDEKQQEGTIDVPGIDKDVDMSKPIEITTYMAIKSNSRNKLNLVGVENVNYDIQNKTTDITNEGNIIIANKNADSKDICKIKITGTYNGQNYINILTIYVEPKNIETRNGQDYYKLYTSQDLVRLSELVNHNVGSIKNAIMMNDIDLQGIDWEPIGNAKFVNNMIELNMPFKGIFDGQNNTIKNMKIHKLKERSYEGVGFIGALGDGSVKNVKFDNSNVYSEKPFVGIGVGVAKDFSLIENVNVLDGKVEAIDNYVGSICGIAFNTNIVSNSIIRNCANNAAISATGENAYYYGGICGNIQVTEIRNCYNSGEITVSKGKGHSIGGIIGQAYNCGKIYSCYNSGKINIHNEATDMSYIGGIVGTTSNKSIVKYCYNLGNISNETLGDNTGGIVGANASGASGANSEQKSVIEYCYNIENVKSNGPYVGGICGYNVTYSTVNNCCVYISDNVQIIGQNSVKAININGVASSYLGKIIGRQNGDEEKNTVVINLQDMPSVFSILTQYIEKDKDGNVISSPWVDSEDNRPKLTEK